MTEENSSIPAYEGDKSTVKTTAKKTAKKPMQAKKTPSPKPKAPPQKPRVPMHQSSGEGVPAEARDKDFHYRWCADYGKGKIQRYLDAGYDYVYHEGTTDKIIKPGGHKRYLMRIPMDLYLEDQLAKQQKVIDTNEKVREENAPKTNSAVPEYVPKGQESVIAKDGLS
jgi:hypothetical protein